MKQQRIYIDTSVVGGFLDRTFEEDTKLLFKRLENKEVIFVLSDLLREELKSAPQRVRSLLDNYSAENFETVVLTYEARDLADKYIVENVVINPLKLETLKI